MPTLVNDLSHSQQLWLFETFGPSNDTEDHFPTHHRDDTGITESHFSESTERRVSDATPVQGEHHDPSQFSPHPHHGHDYYLPHAPDLQHHQPAPSGHHDNRNTIFRRGIENDSLAELPPRPWSPERTDILYTSSSQQQQQPQQYHPQCDPRAFAMLRAPRTTNSRPHQHMPDEHKLVQQQQQKRMSPMEGHPTPFYPHKGEKLTWQQSFDNLQVYKQSYGDCDVPQKYKHNVKLGGWVNKQRKKKKNPAKYGKLSDSQIQMMESIGFKWNVEQGC